MSVSVEEVTLENRSNESILDAPTGAVTPGSGTNGASESQSGRSQIRRVDTWVRDNPWRAVAVAALLGMTAARVRRRFM